MRELEAAGLLSQKRRGLGKTNIYTLHDLRTARIEVQEHHRKSRTSKTEVQEPQKSAILEPPKSAGNIETEEIEIERYDSNIRKASPSTISGGMNASQTEKASDRSMSKLEIVENSSPSRPRTRAYDEARVAIGAYVEDYARELGDEAPLRSTVSRAVNLYRESRIELEEFLGVLEEARAITKERSTSIRKTKDAGGVFPSKSKIPYFFAVVEDLLGVNAEGESDSSTHRRASGNSWH